MWDGEYHRASLEMPSPQQGGAALERDLGVCGQLLSSLHRFQLFATPWTAAHQASLSFTISQSLLKLMSTESDVIQPSHPLSLLSSPALKPS